MEFALRDAAPLGCVQQLYFNASGAGLEGEIGEAHNPETHLVPLAVDAALGLGPPLTLLGDDYPTPDGSCIRDFIHVSDLAEGHICVLKWLQRSPAKRLDESFDLGSGFGYSVRQGLAETARIAGPVPNKVGSRRTGDSPRLVGDIAKSKLELGWRPTRDFTTQIEDTLRWRRKMAR